MYVLDTVYYRIIITLRFPECMSGIQVPVVDPHGPGAGGPGAQGGKPSKTGKQTPTNGTRLARLLCMSPPLTCSCSDLRPAW